MGTTIFAVLVILSSIASVTNPGAGAGGEAGAGAGEANKPKSKYAFLMGPLYPSGGTLMTEDVSTVGIKYTMAMNDPTEFTLLGGNGKGHSFYMGMVSIKKEVDAINEEGIAPFYYFGLHGVYFHGANSSGVPLPFRTGVGAHLGFGLDIKINHYLTLRNDYTFGIGPGKILFAGLAFQYT
ncbi:hypothetical protein N9W41_01520, partial [bacterium]|nr:hypothetical protein [bacterium]